MIFFFYQYLHNLKPMCHLVWFLLSVYKMRCLNWANVSFLDVSFWDIFIQGKYTDVKIFTNEQKSTEKLIRIYLKGTGIYWCFITWLMKHAVSPTNRNLPDFVLLKYTAKLLLHLLHGRYSTLVTHYTAFSCCSLYVMKWYYAAIREVVLSTIVILLC